MINFVGADGSWEWAGILRDSKRGGACGEFEAFGLFKDHANMSVIKSSIGGRVSSEYCSITCELVHFVISWLAVDLSNLKFLDAFLNVLFDAHGCNRVESLA